MRQAKHRSRVATAGAVLLGMVAALLPASAASALAPPTLRVDAHTLDFGVQTVGTKLTSTNGKSYHTTAGVTVPATDFVGQTFGTVEVGIQADEPGPDSNGGDVSGGYGNAIFITIARPSGGTTRPVKIVEGSTGRLVGTGENMGRRSLRDVRQRAG